MSARSDLVRACDAHRQKAMTTFAGAVGGWVLGWIVVDQFGITRKLGNYSRGPKLGLLLRDGVTLFATQTEARAAICRTQRYATKHRLKWGVEFWNILDVTRQLESYRP